MAEKLKVLMIGAHLDDNDFCAGGTALKYLAQGHEVRFLSLCNGCGGHHENSPELIAKRRYQEAQKVAKLTGLTYDVWEIPDCELVADLQTRKRLIKYIREYGKDVKLRDIPFYVVDISDYNHPSIYGYNDSLRQNYEDILGAVSCAYKRFRRSNSEKLIEIGYTLKDFLQDNPMLYTKLNTHLDLTALIDCCAKL